MTLRTDFNLSWRKRLSSGLLCALLAAVAVPTQAGLFDDDEARKAILELRQRLDAHRVDTERRFSDIHATQEQGRKSTGDDVATTRRALLDLQTQIETLRADMAGLRGQNEQLVRDNANLLRQLAEVQRQQKDAMAAVDDRVRRFEPAKVTVDGREFVADPTEKRDFEIAMDIFRKGEFPGAQTAFLEFARRYPQSGYLPSALFWLGNAQYATRDYKEAITNFRLMLSRAPDHARAPEAALSIANCQIELKDARSARRTLEDLLKAYPQSEAALAGKDRLARLR